MNYNDYLAICLQHQCCMASCDSDGIRYCSCNPRTKKWCLREVPLSDIKEYPLGFKHKKDEYKNPTIRHCDVCQKIIKNNESQFQFSQRPPVGENSDTVYGDMFLCKDCGEEIGIVIINARADYKANNKTDKDNLPVKPISVGRHIFKCECNKYVNNWDNFCSSCGRQLDWSEINA